MNRKFAYAFYAAAALFLFSFLTAKIPLWSSDEGRYGEIAREMLETREIVVPQFNYIDFLEKPVLAPLVTAFSCAIFGVNAFSVRLPVIVSALLGILLCFIFTRRLFNRRTAEWAALLLATSVGYVLVGRFAVIDMIMTLFLSAALFCLMTAFFEREGRYYLLSYVLMGLAFLTKGLIGLLLPALIFLAFLIWTGNLQEIKRMSIGWGLVIVGAVTFPWLIAISIVEPEFFNTFIVQQHFARFVTQGFGRRRPFWFFAPIFLGLGFPWTFFLPAAVGNGLKREGKEKEKIQFLICWMAVIFIFFSIPRSKLPYYLLPLSMPLAILIATYFPDWIERKRQSKREETLLRWSWRIILGVLAVAAVGINLFIFFFNRDAEILTLKPVLVAVSAVLALGGAFSYYFYRRDRRAPAVLTLAGMIYLGLLLTAFGMKIISPFQSSFAFAKLLNQEAATQDIIAIYASPDHFSDLPFYLKRRVMVAGSDRGTLTVQSREEEESGEAETWFLGLGDFVRLFRSGEERIFCLLDDDRLPELEQEGIQDYKILKHDHRKILLTNSE